MKKKRVLLTLGLPLIVAMAFGILVMIPPRPGVTKANFDRIQNGMTLAEVREIFGEKECGWVMGLGPGRSAKDWYGDDWCHFRVTILFANDLVIDKQWFIQSETLETLQRWFNF